MAYTQSGSLLAYFQPDAVAPIGVIDVGAASADAGELVCVKPCVINEVQFHVTDEAISGTTTAPTVVFTKRPTPNSATSEEVVATLTLPSGTAVGKVIYKANLSVAFEVGDSLEISHTVGVGTPTGQGIASAICSDNPENRTNMSDMIASA